MSQDLATSPEQKSRLLRQTRDTLRNAQAVIDRRVAHFRVPADRISGWRQNPTVYPYGYVWAARSL
jgi:hypothetical protein